MKKIQTVSCAIVILLLSNCYNSFAQGAAQEREYTRQREAARVKSANEASIKQNADNNRPSDGKRFETNTRTSTPYSVTPEKKFITYEDNIRRAENERKQREYLEKEKIRKALLLTERSNNIEANKKVFLKAYVEKNPLPNLPYDDQHAFLELVHHKSMNGYPLPQRTEEAAAYKNYLKDSSTADFKTLMAYAITMQFAPTAAMQCIKTMYRRFPEKKSNIEQNELFVVIPGFFGSSNINITWPSDYYAWTHYDVSDQQGRDALIDRFDLLSRNYPDIGLKAAGRCRIGLNPYQLLADRNETQSIDVRSDYFFKVVMSVHDSPGDAKNYFYKTYADQRMRRAGEWLNYYAKNRMDKLTVADWQAMAKAQDLPLESLAWAFRNANDEANYLTKYRNLHKAMRKSD